jgi:hypothetical protein
MHKWLFLAVVAVSSCSSVQAIDDSAAGARAPATPRPAARRGNQPVEVEMSNVHLHVTGDITLRIRHLRGRFEPIGGAQRPSLDDKHSYVVAIDSGEIALDMPSLNALMRGTLGQGHSNVEKVRVSAEDDNRLRQRGVLHKGIKVPFDVAGNVEATPDGRIRMHAAAVRSFGLPVHPLLKLFGVNMDDLLKVKPGVGITVEKDDLILDPGKLVPPPLIRGKVTSVRVADGALIQTFGSGERQRLAASPTSRNYIYWRGNELEFGKLTMTDTDLELIDEDQSDPFDFSSEDWNEQLVAGYSKTMPDRSLKAHMPDFNDLERARAKR